MRLLTARWLLLVAGALVLAGCSSYDARWQAARNAKSTDAYSGAWEGRWTSARHAGQGDRLRCILSPSLVKKGAVYEAEFEAVWLKVFSSTHKVSLQILPGKAGRPLRFTGSAKLSTAIGGGTYSCTGSITPTYMKATYDATYDAGTFDLQRATAAPPPPSVWRTDGN